MTTFPPFSFLKRSGSFLISSFNPQNHDASQNEGARDHLWREQMGFDEVTQKDTQESGWHESNEDIHGKSSGGPQLCQGAHGVPNFLPKHQQHREYRARLNRNVKDLGPIVVEIDQ